MTNVKRLLEQRGVPMYMVQTRGLGDRFGPQTTMGLYHAKALLAFCTCDYGEKTGAGYETYVELQYAYQKKLMILPVQLCDIFPPKPIDEDGCRQNDLVFWTDMIRFPDIGMQKAEEVADKVAEAWKTWIQET